LILALLGLWESIPNEGEKSEPIEQMLVLKYSATEYLVQYPTGKDAIYFRAYPIEIAGRKCVQLEIAGYESGPPEESEKKRFDVIAYEVADSTLVVWTLNSDPVKDGLKTTDALARAFRDHKGDKDLFTDPGRYRRVRR